MGKRTVVPAGVSYAEMNDMAAQAPIGAEESVSCLLEMVQNVCCRIVKQDVLSME